MLVFRRLNVDMETNHPEATPVEAQKQAGHTSLDITILYTQTEEERERQKVNKILEHLRRVKKPAAEAVENLNQRKAAGSIQ
jgi:hypothetical protein